MKVLATHNRKAELVAALEKLFSESPRTVSHSMQAARAHIDIYLNFKKSRGRRGANDPRLDFDLAWKQRPAAKLKSADLNCRQVSAGD
jgi:hypothetical protein